MEELRLCAGCRPEVVHPFATHDKASQDLGEMVSSVDLRDGVRKGQ